MINYTVQKGDSLWRIGRDVVGLNWRFLVPLNPQIKDPNKIVVGQVIRVPDPTYVSLISEVGDLMMIICPYKPSVIIDVIRFFVEGGTTKSTKEIATFLVQAGISATFAGKVEVVFKMIGKQRAAVLYDWWCRFWDYGINKMIDRGEK